LSKAYLALVVIAAVIGFIVSRGISARGIVARRVTQLERNRAPEVEPVASWWFYRDWRMHLIILASGLRLRRSLLRSV
jgi:hypothetical protein